MLVNNDFQKNSNISQVFETLWKNQDCSRIEISKKLGIYRSTVSNLIDIGLENKLICEGERGTATEKGGRKPICLSVNKDFGKIAGIEIQQDCYCLVILDFCGNVIFSKRETLSFSGQNGLYKPAFIRILDEIINPVIKEWKGILGICLGLPGIIDTKTGIIKKSSPFQLENLDFAKELFLRYKIPLLIENDAKCCAWFHGLQKKQSEKNFLCVLTRDHAVNGISVGLSVVMSGKILNGNNYSAGEYVSFSWRPGKQGQTGLPEAVIKTITQVDDSYCEWLKDMFSTLTVMVPLLGPKKIYLYGQGESKKELILQVLKTQVPQFGAMLTQFGSELVIEKDDPFEIAKGAALMFIQLLFQMPFLEDSYFYSELNWNALFLKAKC